jgi:septal ring factor EnvC (AmiA/AmiB activator)
VSVILNSPRRSIHKSLMSGTESSDLNSRTSIQIRLSSEEFQNLTHSEQITYLTHHLSLAEAKIKTQTTKLRSLENQNKELQRDKIYRNQLTITLRGKIRSTSRSLKNQIEESLRSNHIQILTTQLNSVLNSEIVRLKSKIDITDRNNLHIFDRHPGINQQIELPNQNPERIGPACPCYRPDSPPTSPLSH